MAGYTGSLFIPVFMQSSRDGPMVFLRRIYIEHEHSDMTEGKEIGKRQREKTREEEGKGEQSVC
jgi:hypothetical protein